MTDLTERLAAKLGRGECVTIDGERMVYLVRAKYLLPLLLSEPELVASLPDEVRVQALESLLNSAPVMESLLVDAAEVLALAPEELRLSVLTPRERADLKVAAAAHAMGMGEPPKGAIEDFYVALAEARALTPEVPRVG